VSEPPTPAEARTIAVHLLQSKLPRPVVDKSTPTFECWTFRAESEVEASSWRKQLQDWLQVKPDKRRYLIVVNPLSGTRKAMKLVTSTIKPLLNIGQVQFDTLGMRHSGHLYCVRAWISMRSASLNRSLLYL
jgi:hypothetical protein